MNNRQTLQAYYDSQNAPGVDRPPPHASAAGGANAEPVPFVTRRAFYEELYNTDSAPQPRRAAMNPSAQPPLPPRAPLQPLPFSRSGSRASRQPSVRGPRARGAQQPPPRPPLPSQPRTMADQFMNGFYNDPHPQEELWEHDAPVRPPRWNASRHDARGGRFYYEDYVRRQSRNDPAAYPPAQPQQQQEPEGPALPEDLPLRESRGEEHMEPELGRPELEGEVGRLQSAVRQTFADILSERAAPPAAAAAAAATTTVKPHKDPALAWTPQSVDDILAAGSEALAAIEAAKKAAAVLAASDSKDGSPVPAAAAAADDPSKKLRPDKATVWKKFAELHARLLHDDQAYRRANVPISPVEAMREASRRRTSTGEERFLLVLKTIRDLYFWNKLKKEIAQLRFIRAFLYNCASVIYGDDWEASRMKFFEQNGLFEEDPIVLIMAARRVGKTWAVAIFSSAMIWVVPSLPMNIFSTNLKTAKHICSYIRKFILALPDGPARLATQNQTEVSVIPADAVATCVSEQAKRMCPNRSTITALSSSVDGTCTLFHPPTLVYGRAALPTMETRTRTHVRFSRASFWIACDIFDCKGSDEYR